MNKRKYKYIIFGFITVLIFSIINILVIQLNLLYQSNKNKVIVSKTIKIQDNFISNNNHLGQNQPELNPIKNNEKSVWKIIIPRINIEAKIGQGTTQEVLAKSVGHFEITPKFNGNIGLAAHNNTFFKQLKNIKKGDKIIYMCELGSKEYEVTYIDNIEETDWSKLENTQENRITLITCVKNVPQLRLCVQAVEI